VTFHPASDNTRCFFKKAAVDVGEGGWSVAVNVDFANDAAMSADRDDDLGFCAYGAG
jgi:hypothetical protein